MKPGEKGYGLIELLIAITIMAVAAGAAGAAIFQVLRNTGHNNDHMTAVRQVENAGYWISHDAQMAQSATTNLTSPNFLVLGWTAWADNGTTVYYSANYTFEDLSEGSYGIGKLKRTYVSGGTSQQSLVAQYIYYNLGDATNTSNISYESQVLTVKLTAVFEGTQETREYKVKRRLSF